MSQKKIPISALWLVMAFIATFYSYRPGLSSGFMFDDNINILLNPYIRINGFEAAELWQAAMSGAAGMLKRPISMLSFALNYYGAGLDPYYFKLVNILIHLVNGFLIFVVSRLLLQLCSVTGSVVLDKASIQWASLCASAIWMMHPINLTSVLYVVQRMTSLATLFVLLGMTLYLYARRRMLEQKGWHWPLLVLSLFGGTGLAVLSKENGLLLPILIFVTEAVLLRWNAPAIKTKRTLQAFLFLMVVVPFSFSLAYVVANPSFITYGYAIRNFDLGERLMTEARVLWLYLRLFFVPDLGLMGFHHDDIQVSRSLLNPLTTLPAVLGLVLVTIVSWLLRKKYPLILFGIAFFLAGHLLESTVFALEIAYEHRNYLPLVGFAIVTSTIATSGSYHPRSLPLRRLGMIAFIMVLAGLTYLRASHWANPLELKLMEVEQHPNSVRAHVELAAHLSGIRSESLDRARANYEKAIFHFRWASTLSDTDLSGLFGWVGVSWERGFQVDEAAVRALASRLEHVPFAPSSANSLMAMGKCQFMGRCKNNSTLMLNLLDAALRNPTLRGKEKAMVLFTYSDYLSIIQKRDDEAIRMARLAMAASPRVMEHRFVLVKILINLGRLTEASLELDLAKGVKGAHSYAPTIQELEDTIDRARALQER